MANKSAWGETQNNSNIHNHTKKLASPKKTQQQKEEDDDEKFLFEEEEEEEQTKEIEIADNKTDETDDNEYKVCAYFTLPKDFSGRKPFSASHILEKKAMVCFISALKKQTHLSHLVFFQDH